MLSSLPTGLISLVSTHHGSQILDNEIATILNIDVLFLVISEMIQLTTVHGICCIRSRKQARGDFKCMGRCTLVLYDCYIIVPKRFKDLWILVSTGDPGCVPGYHGY